MASDLKKSLNLLDAGENPARALPASDGRVSIGEAVGFSGPRQPGVSASDDEGSNCDCSLYMDSGVMQLFNIAQAHPDYRKSKIRYAVGADRETGMDMLGKITPPAYLSHDYPEDNENAPSFYAAGIGTRTDKKTDAARCPPSMFSGLARLWAQAIYGRHQKHYDCTSDGAAAQPRIKAVVQEETVYIDSNTGIYIDSYQRPWYVRITASGVEVREFVFSAPMEKIMRDYKTEADAVRKTKMLAYILAHARLGTLNFLLPLTVPTISEFGYGWHFNGSGSVADIIRVEELGAGTTYRFRSTHHRITITRSAAPYAMDSATEALAWSAVSAVIEGPSEWKNRTFVDVIAYPEWGTGYLRVLGGTPAKFGTPFGSNAPLYCFYQDNTLVVARYSYTQNSLETDRYESSHQWYGGNNNNGCFFVEADIGKQSWKAMQQFDNFSLAGSVGGVSHSVSSKSYSGPWRQEEVMCADEPSSWGSTANLNAGDYPAGHQAETSYLPDGCYSGGTTNEWEGSDTWGGGLVREDFIVDTTMHKAWSGNHTTHNSGNVMYVVPFMDSEAIYFYQASSDIVTTSGTEESATYFTGQSTAKGSYYKAYQGDVNKDMFGKRYYLRPAGVDSSEIPVTNNEYSDTVTTGTSSVSLVCAAGTVEAAAGAFPVESLMGGTDIVEQRLDTLSAASGNSAIGHGVPITGGYPVIGLPLCFVGWA